MTYEIAADIMGAVVYLAVVALAITLWWGARRWLDARATGVVFRRLLFEASARMRGQERPAPAAEVSSVPPDARLRPLRPEGESNVVCLADVRRRRQNVKDRHGGGT